MQAEKFILKVDSIKHETAKAMLIIKDGAEHWLPLSQVSEIHRDESDPYIVITAWLAKTRGFI